MFSVFSLDSRNFVGKFETSVGRVAFDEDWQLEDSAAASSASKSAVLEEYFALDSRVVVDVVEIATPQFPKMNNTLLNLSDIKLR